MKKWFLFIILVTLVASGSLALAQFKVDQQGKVVAQRQQQIRRRTQGWLQASSARVKRNVENASLFEKILSYTRVEDGL